MNYTIGSVIIVVAAVVMLVVTKYAKGVEDSINRESKPTQQYKSILLESCYTYLVDAKTRAVFHRHNFDWSFIDDALQAKWEVSTDKYNITFYGTSTTIHDVKSFEEFVDRSDIKEATIFTMEPNITVLHRYTNKKDVNILISAVKRLYENYNNTLIEEKYHTNRYKGY